MKLIAQIGFASMGFGVGVMSCKGLPEEGTANKQPPVAQREKVERKERLGQGGEGGRRKQEAKATRAPPADVKVRMLAVGDREGCGVERESGRVFCWSESGEGGESGLRPAFQPGKALYIEGVKEVKSLSTYQTKACAVNGEGRVQCWSWRKRGGDGALVVQAAQTLKGLKEVEEVVVTSKIHYARTALGEVWIWGEVEPGRVLGANKLRGFPKEFGLMTQLVASESHACGLFEQKQVVCWGKENKKAELGAFCVEEDEADDYQVYTGPICRRIVGSPTKERPSRYPPGWTRIIVPSLERPRLLKVGEAFGCAIHKEGDVDCWGSNEDFRVGLNHGEYRASPSYIVGLRQIEELACGRAHTCAVERSGRVQCWGNNQWGQLGSTEQKYPWVPVEVQGVGEVQSLALSDKRSCAIKRDGSTVCWGGNKVAATQERTAF